MRTFFSVLAALLVAFVVCYSWAQYDREQNRKIEQWQSNVTSLTTGINLAFKEHRAIGEEAGGSSTELIRTFGAMRRISKQIYEAQGVLRNLLEKPPRPLNPAEQRLLADVRKSIKAAEQEEKEEAVSQEPSPITSPSPAPVPTPSFASQVAESQRRAVTAYPDLGDGTSALNQRFRVRLADWRARGDLHLSRPDWPERLADQVATEP